MQLVSSGQCVTQSVPQFLTMSGAAHIRAATELHEQTTVGCWIHSPLHAHATGTPVAALMKNMSMSHLRAGAGAEDVMAAFSIELSHHLSSHAYSTSGRVVLH